MAERPILTDELRALGQRLDVQPAPGLADQVMAGIAARRTGGSPWLRVAAIVVAVLLAFGVIVAVSPPVRAAIERVFGGVQLRHTGAPPSPAPSPMLPGEHRTDLAGAAREVGFAVRLPAALGTPDEVIVADRRVVSLRYQTPAGLVRLDEFRGDLGVVWQKFATATAEPVVIGDRPGFWFSKAVTLEYVDPNGTPDPESVRLAASTLIWTEGHLTLRLEGIPDRARAVAIAATTP